MKSPAYVLAIMSSGGLVPTVTFNGWLAYRKPGPEWDGRTTASRKLNAWLFHGVNVLRVHASPLVPAPKGLSPDAPDHALRIWLYKAEHGRDPEKDPEITLLDYRWDRSLQPIAEEGETELLRHQLLVKTGFGRWSWQDARPYMPADRPAVEALVRELHDALVRGDAERFTDGMAVKLEEFARATQRVPNQVLAEERAWMRGLMGMPEWRVEPVEIADLEMESSADGRLVAVRRRDGSAPLKAWLADEPLEYDITVSQLGGAWTVTR